MNHSCWFLSPNHIHRIQITDNDLNIEYLLFILYVLSSSAPPPKILQTNFDKNEIMKSRYLYIGISYPD